MIVFKKCQCNIVTNIIGWNGWQFKNIEKNIKQGKKNLTSF